MDLTTEKWSRILKVFAKVFAVLMMALGALTLIVFGILGVGADGMLPADSRISALFGGPINMALAVLYWLPNEKVEPYKKLYLVFTLYLPLIGYLVVTGLLVFTFATDTAFRGEAAVYFAAYLALACLAFSAPASFLLYLKAKQRPSA